MKPSATTTTTITLAKGTRLLAFRYEGGSEGQVMDHIWRLAEAGRAGLDWLDAATLCFLIAREAAMDWHGRSGHLHQAHR